MNFIVCAPDFFDVKYVINPWMENNVNKLDKTQAKNQWNDYYNVIKTHTHVDVVMPEKGLLDMVFVANAALVIGNKCLIANFKYPQRQGETPFWESWFNAKGYDVKTLPPEVRFEGEGDALYDSSRQCIWFGYSRRSDRVAKELVGDFFDKKIILLELVDDSFYHLDTCFSVLPNNYVMYLPGAFTKESLENIHRNVLPEHRIELTREEAENFTCNAVALGNTIMFNKASNRVIDILSNIGFLIKEVPLTEFMKAGGSAKCLCLSLYDEF